jgi:hypothetical protein
MEDLFIYPMETHMKRTFLVGAAIAAAVVFGGSANAQNFVTDGDFEGCTAGNNFNVGTGFVVNNAATHDKWLDVNQWVCMAKISSQEVTDSLLSKYDWTSPLGPIIFCSRVSRCLLK